MSTPTAANPTSATSTSAKSTFPFRPLQRAWLDALRSGRFAQGACNLQTDKAFCCLGVACIVGVEYAHLPVTHRGLQNRLHGVTLATQPRIFEAYRFRLHEGGRVPLEKLEAFPGLTQEQRGWLEFWKQAGLKEISLIDINDSGHFSFPEIADIIEAFPEYIFYTHTNQQEQQP